MLLLGKPRPVVKPIKGFCEIPLAHWPLFKPLQPPTQRGQLLLLYAVVSGMTLSHCSLSVLHALNPASLINLFLQIGVSSTPPTSLHFSTTMLMISSWHGQ